jgi:queuosine precursor transporter
MNESTPLMVVYVAVVAVTLWLSGEFGPWVSVADSFAGIGLVIAVRARLQVLWLDEYLIMRMLALTILGGTLALAVNLTRPHIGVASMTAFLFANWAASTVQLMVPDRSLAAQTVWSAILFAPIDSVLFVILAFGAAWPAVIGQIACKIAGAAAYAFLLDRVWPGQAMQLAPSTAERPPRMTSGGDLESGISRSKITRGDRPVMRKGRSQDAATR